MAGLVKKFLASASVVAGMSAVFGAPAMANPQIEEIFLEGQGVIYEDDGQGGFYQSGADYFHVIEPNSILDNAENGNIELGGNTNHNFVSDILDPTYMDVDFDDGSRVTFRSLDWYDWFATDDDLGWTWFNKAWHNNSSGLQNWYKEEFGISNRMAAWDRFSAFADYVDIDAPGFDPTKSPLISPFSGYGMLSDANIASVSKDEEGNVFFTMAGHNEHSSGTAFSEVVAVEIDDVTYYAFQIGAPDELSGTKDGDAEGSFEGLYHFTITQDMAGGILSEDVPEPSTVLGLMAVGGLVAATKRKSKK